MATDKQHINLKLDAHNVSLEVLRENESIYREAAALLNRRYQYYQRLYPNAATEQLWMYTALEVAVSLKSDAREKSLIPVENELKKMNQLILDILNITNNQ